MAAVTTSPAPAEVKSPLGPWADADFSDPRVREKVYEIGLKGTANKPEDTIYTFSQCCGSVVMGDGGKRTYPFVKPTYPVAGDPTAYLLGTIINDGTVESMLEATKQRYTQDWLDWVYKTSKHYSEFDPRYYIEYSGLNQKQAEASAEQARRHYASRYTVTNTHRLIFAWGMSAQEAIDKWWTKEEYKSTAKGLDFDDEQDGKAALIWTDA